jgi:hypothetical protein
MSTYPYRPSPLEPSQKHFWAACYTAALTRMSAEEALAEADKALELSNKRWENAPTATTWQYLHNYPLGHVFVDLED